MKKCFKCCETKPLDDFYKHKMMFDGHLNKCKVCAKGDVNKHRKDNSEYYSNFDRTRNMSAERVAARKEYIQSDKGKIIKKKSLQNYFEKFPEKKKAVAALNNAVASGKVIRKFCEMCTKPTKAQAHHEDYSKPLEVVWLCPKHHKERHRELASRHIKEIYEWKKIRKTKGRYFKH